MSDKISFMDAYFKLDNHRTFYSIAYQHHLQIVRLVAECNQRTVKDDEDVDFVCEKSAAIQRSAMVVVIFSALTLEAFINHYGTLLKELGFHLRARRERRDSRMNSALSAASAVKKGLFAVESLWD